MASTPTRSVKFANCSRAWGEVFAPDNVDYAYAGGANRFFICYRDLWYAVTFSDTTLLIRSIADLHGEICRAVYTGQRPADKSFRLN